MNLSFSRIVFLILVFCASISNRSLFASNQFSFYYQNILYYIPDVNEPWTISKLANTLDFSTPQSIVCSAVSFAWKTYGYKTGMGKKLGEFIDSHKKWVPRQFADYIKNEEHLDIKKPFDALKALSKYSLYQFPGYREYIKEALFYPVFIKTLQRRLHNDTPFKRDTDECLGMQPGEFTQIIDDLVKTLSV